MLKKITMILMFLTLFANNVFAALPVTSNGVYVPQGLVNNYDRYQDPYDGYDQIEIQQKIANKTGNNSLYQQYPVGPQGQTTNDALIAQYYANLAAMQYNVTSQNIIVNNPELNMQQSAYASGNIASGYAVDGSGYGFARLADYLSTKHGAVKYVSQEKISDTRYKVNTTGGDNYANGSFIVDVKPIESRKLEAPYQFFFAVYDINKKQLATAHAYKTK